MSGRIQLRRAKGWRLAPNAVKVDRSTRWGNPFIVGKHGDRAECLRMFELLLTGHVCVSVDAGCVERQRAFLAHWAAHREQLRGKSLACWCRAGEPCHADLLLAAL